MPITRSQVQGAIKLLNSNSTPNRRGWLQNMLKAEHAEKDVNKALADLESYPEWGARKDLDAATDAAAPDAPVVAPKKPAKRKR